MSTIVTFYEFVKDNPVITLAITLLFSLFVWLYKDSKSDLKAVAEANMAELNEKLKHLCDLEAMISFYLNTTEKYILSIHAIDLYKKLGETNPSFPNEIRKAIVEYYNESDPQKLVTIRNMLQLKINKLRDDKEKIIFESNSSDVADYLTRIFRPLKAVGAVIAFMLLGYIFVYFNFKLDSFFSKVVISFLVLSFLCSFIVIAGVIHIFKKKPKYLKDIKSLSGFVTVILLPCLGIVLNKGALVIAFFFVQILIFLITMRYLREKKSIFIKY